MFSVRRERERGKGRERGSSEWERGTVERAARVRKGESIDRVSLACVYVLPMASAIYIYIRIHIYVCVHVCVYETA